MPLVRKEIIRPGTYWYQDQKTGKPRKLTVTPEQVKYWHEQGTAMLSTGLTVPVPFEHDFDAHPMSPADKLKNNAGWVKQYELGSVTDPKTKKKIDNVLFGVCDIQNEDTYKSLPKTVRWTSPWINSFVDGKGKQWNNVISHLALTTRPRIVDQEPFGSVAAALSLAEAVPAPRGRDVSFCLSTAHLLIDNNKVLTPRYPLAFSLTTGIALADDMPPMKKGKQPPIDPKQAADPKAGTTMPDDDDTDDDDDNLDDLLGGAPGGSPDGSGMPQPMSGPNGDVGMEELLCDLLQALGVPMPDESNEQEFQRHLYEAAMSKIKELAAKGNQPPPTPNPNLPKPGATPGKPPQQPNPLINQVQQEQQPMYMSTEQHTMASLSLDDINKIEDTTMRTFALSMYTEMEQLKAKAATAEATTEALRNRDLANATKKRADRVAILKRMAPKAGEHLDSMLSLQSMALSMDQSGQIIDPMKATLDTLEAGLANMPRMLTTDHTQLSIVPHPTDADALSAEGEKELVDNMSRMMGVNPEAERQAS